MKQKNKYINTNGMDMNDSTSSAGTVLPVPVTTTKSKKEKPNSSGGFFSGLFKPKGRQTKEKVSSKSTEAVTVTTPLQNNNSVSMNGSTTASTQQEQEILNTVTQSKPQTQQNSPQELSKETQDKIRKDVTTLKMEQILFLYAASDIWGGIQKVFQDYSGIMCLGTSDLFNLRQDYEKCCYTVSMIYIFISNNSEVHELSEFIKSLDLINLMPEVLSIRIIANNKVNINEIRAIPNSNRYIKSFTTKFEELTEVLLQKILSEVVSKQPTYLKDEPQHKEPAKSNFVDTTKNLYNNYDVTEISKAVEKARNNMNVSVTVNSITERILSTNSSLTALDIVKSAPTLEILTSVENDIAKKINKMKYNPLMKEEVEELIKTKLLITSLSTKEVKTLITQIVENASESAKNYQAELDGVDMSILDDIEDIKADAQELLETRNTLKRKIVDAYNKYKKQSSTIVSMLEVEKTQYALVDRDLCNTIEDHRLNFSDETESALHLTINRVRSFEDEVTSIQLNIRSELEKAFNNANALLRSQQALIELDDSLLNIFQETIEEQNRIIKARTTTVLGANVSTRFAERASIIYVLPDTNFRTIMSNISDSGDMFIILNTNNDIEFPLYRTEEDFGIYENNFNGYDLDDIRRSDNIQILNITYPSENETLMAQLDYLASYFNHIFILAFNNNIITPIEDSFYQSVKKIIYWATPLQQKMFALNQVKAIFNDYNNLVLHKVLFDGWSSEWDLDYKNNLRAVANLTPDDGEIMVSSIERYITGTDCVLDDIIRGKLRSIKKYL